MSTRQYLSEIAQKEAREGATEVVALTDEEATQISEKERNDELEVVAEIEVVDTGREDPILCRDEIEGGNFIIMLKGEKVVELGRMAEVVKTTRGLVIVRYPNMCGVLKTKKMLVSNVLRVGAGI